jgi:glyoxylate/hydroxypyruvate reductase
MAIMCLLHDDYGDHLIAAIRAALPDEDVREWPDVGNPADIEYAIVFRMPADGLQPFRNLRMISTTGAGVDHLVRDPQIAGDVSIVRVIDDEFAARMADYVLCWVLFYHRDVALILEQKHAHLWRHVASRPAGELRVGVMGLGQMGGTTARRLCGLGYDVAGWSRGPHDIPGVTSFAGPEEFDAFLHGIEILVNLLPLTVETAGILSSRTFNALPSGSVVISAGRGAHLIEADLLASLESGRIRAATIDAFPREPLSVDHPFWSHPRVFITPHCATTASPQALARSFANNVRRHRRGEPLMNKVERARGY